MTPATQPEQPKEHIITEDELNTLHEFIQHCPSYVDDIVEAIRSRPIPTAPTEKNCNSCIKTCKERKSDAEWICGSWEGKKTNNLNNQPEGTTCEDCQRFRKESCPYPGSNITIDRCNAFLIDIKQHDSAIRNATLDELQQVIFMDDKHLSKISEIGMMVYEEGDVQSYIESLRQQSTEARK